MILFLVAIVIYIVGLNNDNSKNSYIKIDNKNYNSYEISVYFTNTKEIKKIDLEQYVIGVVSAEMPAQYEIEALKAQAVAARTFAVAHMEQYGGEKYNKAKGADVTDSEDCQVYMDKQTRMEKWDKKYANDYYNKICKAVEVTKGQILTYNNKLVMEPYYFAISSGRTENGEDIFGNIEPYLKSVLSDGEMKAPKYKSKISMSYSEFIKALKSKYKNCDLSLSNIKTGININKRFIGGTVKEIKLSNITISGIEFRKLFNLNSADFSFNYKNNDICIQCLGYGHDVGMSQWGANIMAKKGADYKEILTHYYYGVKIM
jgi:stage II sporulation protein D